MEGFASSEGSCAKLQSALRSAHNALRKVKLPRWHSGEKTLIGRPAAPQEIADAVAFAVSSGYMTGAIVNMLGGMDLFVF
jgi:NAD(P)-dependent dehydrogenase (short-subunit alcohol dehydrogenase family)